MTKRWTAGILAVVTLMGAIWYWLGSRRHMIPPPLVFRGVGGAETIALSPNGRLVAEASRSGQVALFNAVTGKQKWSIVVRTHWMAFSPDGSRLLTVSPSATLPYGLVQIWDTATGAPLARFAVPPNLVITNTSAVAATSPDLHWAAIRGKNGCLIYDIWSGRRATAFALPTGFGNPSFSADSRLFATDNDSGQGSFLLCDTKTWRPIHTLDGRITKISGVRFSPDGTKLALSSPAGLTWWDTRTWKQQGQFALPSPRGLPRGYYRFSSDSRSLLICQMEPNWRLHQLDCATGRETMTLPDQFIVRASLTGNRALTVVEEEPYNILLQRGTYCLWDVNQHRILYQITVVPDTTPLLILAPNTLPVISGNFQIYSHDLSADGRVFAVGGYDDGIIRVWHLP